VREITGVDDPYRDLKRVNIREALELYPDLKKMLDESEDRLEAAIRLAIAGNVIDLGVSRKFVLKDEIEKILKQDFAVFHYSEFREHLDRPGHRWLAGRVGHSRPAVSSRSSVTFLS
ncbi:MAG: ARMT1-like domain-containing protein, partial [Pirellulaceae bacterium]